VSVLRFGVLAFSCAPNFAALSNTLRAALSCTVLHWCYAVVLLWSSAALLCARPHFAVSSCQLQAANFRPQFRPQTGKLAAQTARPNG